MYKIAVALSALFAVSSAVGIGGGWGSSIGLGLAPTVAIVPGGVSSTHRVDANVPVAVVPRLTLGGGWGSGLGLSGGLINNAIIQNQILGGGLRSAGLINGALIQNQILGGWGSAGLLNNALGGSVILNNNILGGAGILGAGKIIG